VRARRSEEKNNNGSDSSSSLKPKIRSGEGKGDSLPLVNMKKKKKAAEKRGHRGVIPVTPQGAQTSHTNKKECEERHFSFHQKKKGHTF